MDFEFEYSVKYPYKNQNDSDNGYYFQNISEEAKRNTWFNPQLPDADYNGDESWK